MKKIIVVCVICVLIFALSGFGTSRINDIDANLKKTQSKYFDAEIIEDLGGGSLIIVDKNTNVLYLFIHGYQSSAMTPIYNSDGTVMLYQDHPTEKGETERQIQTAKTMIEKMVSCYDETEKGGNEE